MRRDPLLAARMAYCGPRGIPLSKFLHWPVDDQQAALTWQAEESLKCPNCGTAEWQWEQNPNFAEAEARVCMGCQKVRSESKALEKAAEHMPGLQIRLVPTGGQRGAN